MSISSAKETGRAADGLMGSGGSSPSGVQGRSPASSLTIIKLPDGRFEVFAGSERLAGPFETQAEAWRWIDRHEGDPVSRSEKTAEWSWNRRVHGE